MQGVATTRAALRVVDDVSPDETRTPTPTSRARATMPEIILLDKNWFMRTPSIRDTYRIGDVGQGYQSGLADMGFEQTHV